MSSSGSTTSFASSNIHVSPKASNLSNDFHSSYSYPQGLPPKETQANLHLNTNLFHATKAKDTQPSCNSMPDIPTFSNSLFSLHSPLSLEVVPF